LVQGPFNANIAKEWGIWREIADKSKTEGKIGLLSM
jgi:hypothetical protein